MRCASIVRQDPDVIMIGEMRDLETARIAIQSALTGHLVLSTMHTNDAAGGVTRMLDMGVEDYLLTSTVNAILAQRLVRTLDPRAASLTKYCRKLAKELGLPELAGRQTLYRLPPRAEPGKSDRVTAAVHPFWNCSKCPIPIRRLIMQHATSGELQDLAVGEGMRTMYQDGLNKCLKASPPWRKCCE